VPLCQPRGASEKNPTGDRKAEDPMKRRKKKKRGSQACCVNAGKALDRKRCRWERRSGEKRELEGKSDALGNGKKGGGKKALKSTEGRGKW